MPIYNVAMGQGITVADLGNDTLITGVGALEDSIQNCSAVIFFNTVTRAAGLFHFPSGNIDDDGDSRVSLAAMCAAVQPDEVYIAYGVAGMGFAANAILPADDNHSELRTFILGIMPVPGRLRRMPAHTRVASISQVGNVAVIGNADPGAYDDLRDYARGNYPNFTLYDFM